METMAQVRVTLEDTVRERRLKLKLPDDVPLAQLVPALVRKMGLPKGEYVLVVEATDVTLEPDVTLAGVGIFEGATLRLERVVPEAPPVEAAPLPPEPSPVPVAPAAPRARLPAWAWATGGVVLLGTALALGGMWVSRQAAEREAATAMAQVRATEQAAMTATAEAQATEQAAAKATAQAKATEQAAATATAQAKATEQAAAMATAQAKATEQAAATATAQMQATEQAVATGTAQAKATEQAAATATAQTRAAEQTAATETAQAQATKQAAAASTATASAQTPSEAPSHWPIVFSDSFSTSENGWPMGDYNYDQVTLKILITNGKYRVEAIAHKKFTLWATHPMDFIPDFHLTGEARQVSGPKIRAFGLVFRLTDGDNYGFFGISDDQQFRVHIKHQGEWTRPLDWTETAAIRPGEMNRLKVVAEGSHYLLFINDQKVGEVVDNLLSSGKAGFGLELDAGETAVFEFDNFELRAP
jgi:hypothetical protein